MGARLDIYRRDDLELKFELDLNEPGAMVVQVTHELAQEQQARLLGFYSEFAQLRAGFPEDEEKFGEIGRMLYATVLPEPIRLRLADVQHSLTVVTNDPLLPWEIMHDGSEFLSLRVPIGRKLVFPEQFSKFFRSPRRKSTEFSALIIADPTSDLPGARAEGEALYDLFGRYGKCEILVGEEVTFEKIAAKLMARPYSVIHYSGHIGYCKNTKQGFMRLSNQNMLAREALNYFRGTPLVFLNACYSDGHEKLQYAPSRCESMAQAFMVGNEHGVASAVIGTMWQIPDDPEQSGGEFSTRLYEMLLSGESVGDALKACREHAIKYGPMAWGPYVLYSDPDYRPFAQPKSPMAEVTEAHQVAETASDVHITEPDAATEQATDVEAAEEELETGLPDGTVKQALLSALSEMEQRGQQILSTMHLLIGLCEEHVIDDILVGTDTDATRLCAEVREIAERILGDLKDGYGVSPNVIAILADAQSEANRRGTEDIDGKDILGAILRRTGSAAAQILARHGIALAPDPMSLPSVREAIELAREARLNYIGTPHLLVGLIRTADPDTGRLLRMHHVDVSLLTRQLLAAVGQGNEGADSSGEILITERTEVIFKRTQALAQLNARGELSERDLLVAVLEQEGFTADLLRRIGADPRDMLRTLRELYD